MSEDRLIQIEDALRLVNQLEEQLSENAESFKRATSGEIQNRYLNSNKLAIEKCTVIKRRLLQLQSEEKNKMLSGM